MKKSTKKTILITTSILALSASLFAAFGGNFNFENVLKAKSSNTIVENGTITFNNSDTTKVGSTYTTVGYTQTGYAVKCISINNDNNTQGGIATMKGSTSSISFYESDGSTEFEFQSLKKVKITKSPFDSFNYSFIYTLANGTTAESASQSHYSGEKEYNLTTYGTVTKLTIQCKGTPSSTAVISSLVLTYDCAPQSPLSGIEITSAPTKTSYSTGESFDSTGMVVTASYESGDTADVTSNCTFAPSTNLTPSDTSVAVSYGGFTVYQPITVSNVSVESVEISADKDTVSAGDTLQLSAVIAPSNATNKNVTWSSDDDSVASVDNTGLVTGVSEGTTTITVTTEDGNKTDTFEVTVEQAASSTTYYLDDGAASAKYTVVLNNDGSGYYLMTHPTYSDYDNQQHFTYVVSGTTITFTLNFITDVDYWNTDGNYVRLFTNSSFASYNTTNTGTLSGNNLTIYRCSVSARTTSAKTLVKQA